MNNQINRLHERDLRTAYPDYKSFFDELLEKDNSFIIHHRNIQRLSTEIYRFLNGLFPSIMGNLKTQNKKKSKQKHSL